MSDQKLDKLILCHSSLNDFQQQYIANSINAFFDELDRVCTHNKIDNFQEWFTERTFVSLYINGQVRIDTEEKVLAIQEFVVDESEFSTKGRCDALVTLNKTQLILLEAKFQKYPRTINQSHWDLIAWQAYDNYVFNQLTRYFEAEKSFYIEGRYKELYLQTIVFKVLEVCMDKHFSEAQKNLNINGEMLNSRGWYYSCYFTKDIQKPNCEVCIEVYGTISQVKP